MSWKKVKADWHDLNVVPGIKYPSSYLGLTAGINEVFAVVDNFNIGVNTPGEILDSINNHNMGNMEHPARYTVDIAVFPRGEAFDLLNKCQIGRRYFDLVFQQASDYEGFSVSSDVGQVKDMWNPEYVVFEGCKVRDKNERYALRTKPLVTFNCTALRYVFGQGDLSVITGPGYTAENTADDDLGIDVPESTESTE